MARATVMPPTPESKIPIIDGLSCVEILLILVEPKLAGYNPKAL